MIDNQKVIYLCLFAFSFSIQHALASTIEKNIALARNVCFRRPIIIRFHDLHVGNIRGAMGEISSYHERD